MVTDQKLFAKVVICKILDHEKAETGEKKKKKKKKRERGGCPGEERWGGRGGVRP